MSRFRLVLALTLAAVVGAGGLAAPAVDAAPTCKTDCLRVYSITIYDYLGPAAEAHVKVVDELGGSVRGAVVNGVWTLPDGSEVSRYGLIGTRQRAEFPLYTDLGGTATFTVAGITKPGYTFDPAHSAALSATIDLAGNTPPPPDAGCVSDCVTVGSLRLSERKGDVRAVIVAKDDRGGRVAGAVVSVSWTMPDGTTAARSAVTNRRGKAKISTAASSPGVYTVTVDDITATGLTFDADAGVLTTSLVVG